MTTRWYTLLLLTLLLVSSLPARAACTLTGAFPFGSFPVGCTATECLNIDPNVMPFRYWSPIFNLTCANNKEYAIIELSINPANLDYVTNNSSLNTKILVLADDQYGDTQIIGSAPIDKQINTYTAFGSTSYSFTFSNHAYISNIKLTTAQLPNCPITFGEKILKADDSTSALYQCGLFVESIGDAIQNNPLNGCVRHRCQNYPDKKLVTFCRAEYDDNNCYLKAEHVWMIGTEYDLSSLPKVMIYLAYLIIFFMGILTGFSILG